MFHMIVNKQMRQLRIAPQVLLAPSHIKFLGHPAVRPDVSPEGGSWLQHPEFVYGNTKFDWN